MTLSLISVCMYLTDLSKRHSPSPRPQVIKHRFTIILFFKTFIMLNFPPTSGSTLPGFTFPFFFTNETQVSSYQTLSFSVKKILQSVGEWVQSFPMEMLERDEHSSALLNFFTTLFNFHFIFLLGRRNSSFQHPCFEAPPRDLEIRPQ